MLNKIAWVLGIIFFFVPALWYYLSFYIQALGWAFGLVVSVIFIQTLFPLHFIIAPVFSSTGFWDALWNTWGKVLIGSVLVWFITMFSRD